MRYKKKALVLKTYWEVINMKFKMNNRSWEIVELSQEEICERNNKEFKPEDGRYFGICSYVEQVIYLDKELCTEQKRQTLFHELMHCYIACYCSFEDMQPYHEDVLCNIHDIVKEYFREK